MLIVELDGPAAEVDAQFDEVTALCEANGAFEIRIAADDAERALFWKGRKSAFAAVGRISPDYIVQDGVIPRTALPEVLRRIGEVAGDARRPGGQRLPRRRRQPAPAGALRRRACRARRNGPRRSPGAIIDLCIEYGGSITGEHGVGMDKAKYMPRMFTDDDLDTMQLLRCAFDPAGLANPGKIFPTPRLCGERPGRHRRDEPPGPARRSSDAPSTSRPTGDDDMVGGVPARLVAAPASTEEAAAVLRAAAAATSPWWCAAAAPSSTGARRRARLDLIIDTRRLTGVVEHAAGDLITVVRAGTPLADLRPRRASSSPWTRRCRAPRSAARSRPAPAGRGGCSTARPATC